MMQNKRSPGEILKTLQLYPSTAIAQPPAAGQPSPPHRRRLPPNRRAHHLWAPRALPSRWAIAILNSGGGSGPNHHHATAH